MAIISEDFVSFEVAKLLKEKGFITPCDWLYCSDGTFGHRNSLWDKEMFPAPSQAMAMKWLREVYGLHISLEPCYDYDSMHVVFLAFVQNVADVHEFFDGRKNVASHPNAEKSYELAIKYCLEHLI